MHLNFNCVCSKRLLTALEIKDCLQTKTSVLNICKFTFGIQKHHERFHSCTKEYKQLINLKPWTARNSCPIQSGKCNRNNRQIWGHETKSHVYTWFKKKKLNSCIVLNKILKISALTVTQPVMDKWMSITVSMKILTTCDTQRTVFSFEDYCVGNSDMLAKQLTLLLVLFAKQTHTQNDMKILFHVTSVTDEER